MMVFVCSAVASARKLAMKHQHEDDRDGMMDDVDQEGMKWKFSWQMMNGTNGMAVVVGWTRTTKDDVVGVPCWTDAIRWKRTWR